LENFPEQMQNIFNILGGSIGEEIKQRHTILDKYITREIRICFTDTTNDCDALERG
jgi:hypothetical protein